MSKQPNWHFISISSGDVLHPADIVIASEAGTIRRIPLSAVELGRLTQQAANLTDMAIRELVLTIEMDREE